MWDIGRYYDTFVFSRTILRETGAIPTVIHNNRVSLALLYLTFNRRALLYIFNQIQHKES